MADTKTEVLRVRMTPEDRREISKLAAQQNTSMSEAARSAIKTALTTSKPQEDKPPGQ